MTVCSKLFSHPYYPFAIMDPQSLASLYRLFLRTTGASVLNYRPSTRNLRLLFRAHFDDAAAIVRKAYRAPGSRSDRTTDSLREWNSRVDKTLTLLYNSSQYRGLPHRLTQNLSFFVHGVRRRRKDTSTRFGKIWQPNLDPDCSAYKLPQHRAVKPVKKRPAQIRQEMVEASSLNALDEVIKLAEGRNKIFLGRIYAQKTR
jgi:hypothetical protein